MNGLGAVLGLKKRQTFCLIDKKSAIADVIDLLSILKVWINTYKYALPGRHEPIADSLRTDFGRWLARRIRMGSAGDPSGDRSIAAKSLIECMVAIISLAIGW